MKGFLRSFLFNAFALWFTAEILPAFVIRGNWQAIAIAALVLSLLLFFVKPLLKILFIPINFITFGLFSWVINALVIYLLTLFVPEVRVIAWTFPGVSFWGFVIPPVHLSYILSLIVSSLFITFCIDVLQNLSE